MPRVARIMHPIVAGFPPISAAQKAKITSSGSEDAELLTPVCIWLSFRFRQKGKRREPSAAKTRPAANALDSALYAARFVEVVGGGRVVGRAARVTVSDCRADAAVAQRFCLVRTGSASLGSSFRRNEQRWSAAPPIAPRIPAGLCLRSAVVLRQLLLDPRHDDAVWRHAATGSHVAADWIQPCAGALLRLVRTGRDAGAAGDGKHAPGSRRCAIFVGRAGTGGGADHLSAMGSTGLLAGGQCAGEPACAMDRRVWHQLCSGRRERASRRWLAAQQSPEADDFGHCRRWFCLPWGREEFCCSRRGRLPARLPC